MECNLIKSNDKNVTFYNVNVRGAMDKKKALQCIKRKIQQNLYNIVNIPMIRQLMVLLSIYRHRWEKTTHLTWLQKIELDKV